MPFGGIATCSLDGRVHDMRGLGRCILPSCMLGKFTASLAISLLCLLHGKLDATIWKSSQVEGFESALYSETNYRTTTEARSERRRSFPMNKDAIRSLTGISLFHCNCKELLFGVLISDTSFSCVSQFSASWWKVIKPLCYNTRQ